MISVKYPKRMLLFGGTFNPIHNGHIYITNKVSDILNVQRVIIIPTNIPVHKPIDEIVPAYDRVNMCRLASELIKNCQISDIEIRTGGKNYTVDTLEKLSHLYPLTKLYFLVGADMFLSLDNWKNPYKLFALATICTVLRNDIELNVLRKYQAFIHKKYSIKNTMIFDIPLNEISSSLIREYVKQKKDIKNFVPPKVLQYIKDYSLYK